jgi:hypothetical protein
MNDNNTYDPLRSDLSQLTGKHSFSNLHFRREWVIVRVEEELHLYTQNDNKIQ